MPKTTKLHHKKRHGLHHKQGPRYLKTYLPYLPLVVSIALSLVMSTIQPAKQGTLAYATEMSVNGLLQSTNTQRANNGAASLQLNQKLINAAQAKANDMIARNYWSHNTPDGQEPWVFFDNAGYAYLKAGENLAYGFLTSSDTVTGWMNSASHRANMLDTAFTEVGFGFANGNNFNNSGQETVVVAEYGKPQTLGASTPAPSPTPSQSTSPTPAPQTKPTTPTSNPTPASPTSSTPPDEEPSKPGAPSVASSPTPTNSDFPVITDDGLQPITRAQVLAGTSVPWAMYAVGLISGIAVILLLFKHSLALRHVLINSEKFIWRELHHPWFDSLMLSLIILSITLSHTVGFIL